MEWVTTNRPGLGTENDASEFLRVLIKKTVQELKEVNIVISQFALAYFAILYI